MLEKIWYKKAFTVAEVLMALCIISILAIVLIKDVQLKRSQFLNNFMAYSAFSNLNDNIQILVRDGCTDDEVTDGLCESKSYLPEKAVSSGRGLCERIAQNFNIIGDAHCASTGDASTDPSVILDGTTDFSSLNPTFIVSNSMKFYNIQTDPVTINASNILYTVYVDIDGEQRNSRLGEDVIKLNIRTDGVTLPAYNTTAANTTGYLSASIKYFDSGDNKTKLVSGTNNLNYQTAYCGAKGQYFDLSCSANTYYSSLCNDASKACAVVLNRPTFFLLKS